jgi:hypothetical protein
VFTAPPPRPAAATPPPAAPATAPRRVAAPGIPQRYLDPAVVFSARLGGAFTPHALPARPDGKLVWQPALHAHLALRFDEETAGFLHDVEQHRVWFPLDRKLPDEALRLELTADDILDAPLGDGFFGEVPDWMDEPKELAALAKRVADDVYRTESTGMFVCPPLKLYGRSGEDEAAFRARCEAAVHARVDDAIADLKDKVEAKEDKLRDKLRTAEAKLGELERNASARRTEEVLNVGETMVSWFFGRRKSITTAATKRRQTSVAGERASAAADAVTELVDQLEALERELVEEMELVRERESRALAAITEKRVGLEKSDVTVRAFEIVWIPVARRV